MSEISFDELMAELDKYRPVNITRKELTEEQKLFIIKARNHEKPITHLKMCELWEKVFGWGKISKSSMQGKCIGVLKNQEQA